MKKLNTGIIARGETARLIASKRKIERFIESEGLEIIFITTSHNKLYISEDTSQGEKQ